MMPWSNALLATTVRMFPPFRAVAHSDRLDRANPGPGAGARGANGQMRAPTGVLGGRWHSDHPFGCGSCGGLSYASRCHVGVAERTWRCSAVGKIGSSGGVAACAESAGREVDKRNVLRSAQSMREV